MPRTVLSKQIISLAAMAGSMIGLVSIVCNRTFPGMMSKNTGWNLCSIRGILSLGTGTVSSA
jgi:hypothetical protein